MILSEFDGVFGPVDLDDVRNRHTFGAAVLMPGYMNCVEMDYVVTEEYLQGKVTEKLVTPYDLPPNLEVDDLIEGVVREAEDYGLLMRSVGNSVLQPLGFHAAVIDLPKGREHHFRTPSPLRIAKISHDQGWPLTVQPEMGDRVFTAREIKEALNQNIYIVSDGEALVAAHDLMTHGPALATLGDALGEMVKERIAATSSENAAGLIGAMETGLRTRTMVNALEYLEDFPEGLEQHLAAYKDHWPEPLEEVIHALIPLITGSFIPLSKLNASQAQPIKDYLTHLQRLFADQLYAA